MVGVTVGSLYFFFTTYSICIFLRISRYFVTMTLLFGYIFFIGFLWTCASCVFFLPALFLRGGPGLCYRPLIAEHDSALRTRQISFCDDPGFPLFLHISHFRFILLAAVSSIAHPKFPLPMSPGALTPDLFFFLKTFF